MAQLRWTTVDAPSTQRKLFGNAIEHHVGKGEYRGLEFFHVEARRLINQVPSFLPFEYTVNVYRGCSHACAYCLDGDTQILMADGAQRPLRSLEVGDAVIGTSALGRYRRYRPTTVVDIWSARKPAYRLRLRNGRQIIGSGEHRFLTDYGWMHIAACPGGNGPALAFGSRLLGLEEIPPVAAEDELSRLIDAAVVGPRELIVESVEDLHEEREMFDIATGSGDFVANGLVSHNCFARPTHDYLGLGIGADFDSKIVVKVNAVHLARAETEPGRWAGHRIAMGTNTDPYQRAEGKYRLTRGVVEVLTERRNPFSILTKSPLVLRDLDVLSDAAATMDVVVDFSIATLDEAVWKKTEPGTPHPRQRVEALRKLNEAGVPSGALMAPIIPGLSDDPAQLAETARALVDAGARLVSPMYLHLRTDPLKRHWFDWLDQNHPELAAQFRRDYGTRGNAPSAAEQHLTETVQQAITAAGGLTNPWRMPRADPTTEPAPADQLSLDL